jgi:Golgi apparatus protein 1
VVDCLIGARFRIKKLRCARAVEREMQQRSEDVRLDPALGRACEADVARHCEGIDPGGGRVKLCLRRAFGALSERCRKSVFGRMREEAEGGLPLDPRIRRACRRELARLCPAAGDGEAAGDDGSGRGPAASIEASGRERLGCLRSKRESRRMSARCREAVVEDQEDASRSAALNPDLLAACGPFALDVCGDVIRAVAETAHDHGEGSDGGSDGHGHGHGHNDDDDDDDDDAHMRDAHGLRSDGTFDPQAFGFTAATARGKGALAHAITSHGEVLQCLVEHRERVGSAACAEQLLLVEQAASQDVRLAPEAAAACAGDIAALCADVEPGAGRVHACLRARISELTPGCRAAEFAEAKREASDVRLNPAIRQACAAEISGVCAGVEPGEGRVIRCLRLGIGAEGGPAALRGGAALSDGCRRQVVLNARSVSRNVALSPSLVEACAGELDRGCAEEAEAARAGAAFDGSALQCLVRRYASLQDPACASEVFQAVEAREEDLAQSAALSDACAQDAARLCAGVREGGGRRHACLRSRLDELSDACREAQIAEIAVAETDARLHPAVRRGCAREVRTLCADAAARRARGERRAVYACLADRVDDVAMSSACRGAVTANELLTAEDLRLNPEAFRACADDLEALCGIGPLLARGSARGRAVVLHGGGQACLLEKFSSVGSATCRAQMSAILLHQMSVPRAIPGFAEACGGDAERLCGHVAAAGGDFSGAVGAERAPLPSAGGDAPDAASGHTIGCLRTRLGELTRPCKSMMPLLLKRVRIATALEDERAARLAARSVLPPRAAAALSGLVSRARSAATAGPSGIVVSGSLAVVALSSMAVLFGGVVAWAFRSFRRDTGYRIVPKVRHAENMRRRDLQC